MTNVTREELFTAQEAARKLYPHCMFKRRENRYLILNTVTSKSKSTESKDNYLPNEVLGTIEIHYNRLELVWKKDAPHLKEKEVLNEAVQTTESV